MRSLLATAILIAAATAPAAAAPNPNAAQPVRPVSVAALHGVAVGSYPARAPVEVYVRLAGQRESELDELIAAENTPGTALYGRYLTPEQYGNYFGADPMTYARAIASLRAHGFTIEEMYANRTGIVAVAPASVVSAYFQTPIDFRNERGRTFYANRFEPAFPPELRAVAVSGLDDYVLLHPHSSRAPFSVIDGNFSWGPPDIANAYLLNSLYSSNPPLDGKGVTIANATCGAASASDLALFQRTFKLPKATLLSHPIGGPLTPTCSYQGYNYGNGESSLDVDSATGIAREATFEQVVAHGPANHLFDLSYAYIVNTLGKTVHVVTTSWGTCEPLMKGTPSLNIDEALFKQAAAEGQAWFSAAGDNGTWDCGYPYKKIQSVDFPGSSPYVMSIGGTALRGTITGGVVTAYKSENVWMTSTSNGAGGGGKSVLFSKPAYQTALTPKDGVRDCPDVSLMAFGDPGGTWIADGGRMSGTWEGTSESSPMWAGLLAIVIQRHGNKSVTDPHVRLYALAATKQYHSLFHDIVIGNNGVPPVPGYKAGPGYDLASGLGTFIGAALARAY